LSEGLSSGDPNVSKVFANAGKVIADAKKVNADAKKDVSSHQLSFDAARGHQPFTSVSRSATAIQRRVQAVPACVRVGHENITGSDRLQVEISGMKGAHASKVNGTYVLVHAPPVARALKVGTNYGIWQCVDDNGVAYRNSPSMEDRCETKTGPTIKTTVRAIARLEEDTNWLKIEVKGLGQKYVPITKDGKTLFQFVGWTNQSASEGFAIASPRGVESGRLVASITISGATGINAAFVNGVYDETDEFSCGQHVYIKRSDPRKCIHFWALTGTWHVTETEHKGQNDRGRAYLDHRGGLETATWMNTWNVVEDGNKYHVQPNVRCTATVSSFEGGLKKIDDDIFLEYHAGKFAVCDAKDRRTGKGFIFCDVDPCEKDDCSDDLISGTHLLHNLLRSKNVWYSTADSSTSVPQLRSVNVFHPQLSVTCVPSLPFTGVYRATRSLLGGMPTFLLDGAVSYSIEHCETSACWFIKECLSGLVCAISCAVSPGFPAPIAWTLVEPLSAASHRPLLHPPITVSGAGQSCINGTYFPMDGGSECAFACARQLRNGSSLEFCQVKHQWVLSGASDGPCYYFRPNAAESSEFVTSKANPATGSVQAPQPSLVLPSLGHCRRFPNFTDGVWEAAPNCELAPACTAPTCTLLEDIGVEPISTMLSFNWSKLDRTSMCYWNFPLSLSVAAAGADAEAVLFEGDYSLQDFKLNRQSNALKVSFLNVESGHELLFVISSMQIERVCLKVDCEILFQGMPPSPQPYLAPSPLLLADPCFSIDLFRTPTVVGAAPAFKVQLASLPAPQGSNLLFKRAVVQPRMMPMLTDPACISSVRDLMTKPNFDARSFWRQCLLQLSGHTDVADSNALHRLLVRHAR